MWYVVTAVSYLECLSDNNVSCVHSRKARKSPVLDKHLGIVSTRAACQGDIQLAMCKGRPWKINTDRLESLPLGLVDGHSECWLDWELAPLEHQWGSAVVCGNEENPWNYHRLAHPFAAQN